MDSWRHVVDDIRRVVARIHALLPSSSVCALGISLGAAMTLATSLVDRETFARHAVLSPGFAPRIRLPWKQRLGVAFHAFSRPRELCELPFTVDQLSDSDCASSLDPRARAVTSRFLLEVPPALA
jgi:alpha-beta hydrolase superfamily lysophospholipase